MFPGQKFNRLTIVCRVDNSPGGQTRWRVKCDCGNEFELVGNSIRSGRTKSCGCFKIEQTISFFTKHGHCANGVSPTYHTYSGMISRCTNPKHEKYADYGGRGITICDRWLNSFENFLVDMGIKPKRHSIERIDNSLGYFKENCRWATTKEQSRNKRNSHFITFDGKTLILQDWADILGVNQTTLLERLKKLPLEDAMKFGKLKHPKTIELTHSGLTLPISIWAKRLKIKPRILYQRYHAGLSVADILNQS